jgi:hypothetical protein
MAALNPIRPITFTAEQLNRGRLQKNSPSDNNGGMNMNTQIENSSYPTIIEMMLDEGLREGIAVDILLAPGTVWDVGYGYDNVDYTGYHSNSLKTLTTVNPQKPGVVSGIVSKIDQKLGRVYIAKQWNCTGSAQRNVPDEYVAASSIQDYVLREIRMNVPVQGLVPLHNLDSMGEIILDQSDLAIRLFGGHYHPSSFPITLDWVSDFFSELKADMTRYAGRSGFMQNRTGSGQGEDDGGSDFMRKRSSPKNDPIDSGKKTN